MLKAAVTFSLSDSVTDDRRLSVSDAVGSDDHLHRPSHTLIPLIGDVVLIYYFSLSKRLKRLTQIIST